MWVGTPHGYTGTCTHVCIHVHTHVRHDKHGCLHGGGHLQFPKMFILEFVSACVDTDTPVLGFW